VGTTYFRIDYTDQIRYPAFTRDPITSYYVSGNVPFVLNPSLGLVNDLIARSATYSTIVAPPGATPAQVTILVDTRQQNTARSLVEGIDVSASYGFVPSVGQFDVMLDGTYLTKESVQFSVLTPTSSLLNTVGNPVKLRVKGGVSWSRGGWVATSLVNFTSSYDDPNAVGSATVSVPSWTTVDLSVQYKVDENSGLLLSNSAIVLSAQNVLNKAPPLLPSATVGTGSNFLRFPYDPANANPLGRAIALQLTKRF
jgi:iron complex outermembrane receptor protein